MVCQVWNRMKDPGDGSVHQEYNFTLLKYAGDGRWSYEEDIYNPMRFGAMVAGVGSGPEGCGRGVTDGTDPVGRARARPARGSAALRCRRGRTTIGKDRAPLVGGHPRGGRLLGRGPRRRRGGLRRRRWPPGSTTSTWPPSTAGPRSCWDPPSPRCGTGSSWPARRCATTADGVRAQLEESLPAPQLRPTSTSTSSTPSPTWRSSIARSGAVEAILAARDEGLCRWVGITGHDLTAPAAHLEALRRYDLDTVMFPVNPQLWSDPDLPARRRGAARPRRRARRRGHGHQGGGGPAVGRPGPHLGHLVRAVHDAAHEVARGVRLRAVDPRGPRLLHARGPRRAAHGAGRRRGLHADGCGRARARPWRRSSHEPSIFPMPAA